MTGLARARWYRAAFILALSAFSGGLLAALAIGSRGIDALDRLATAGTRGVAFGAILSALSAALLAAAILGAIAFRNSSSVSPEIFFLSFFWVALSLEALRPALGFLILEGGSLAARDLSVRGIMMARYSGAFAVFVASLHAAGYRNDKPWSVLAVTMVAALGVSAGLPVNSGDVSRGLMPRPGYASLSDFIEIVLLAAVLGNFLYAARSRAAKGYIGAALGAAALLGGAFWLRQGAGWTVVGLASALIAGGAVAVLVPLRRYYLWQ